MSSRLARGRVGFDVVGEVASVSAIAHRPLLFRAMTTTVVPVRPGEMTRASRHKEVPVGEQEPKEEPPSPLQPQEKKTKETKKKQKQAKVMSLDSPYPDFARPSAAECRAVEQVLLGVHGPPPKAEEMTFEDDEPGPEGQAIVTDRGKSESILDAVIRVVLGLNTSARVSVTQKNVKQA